MSKWFKSSFCSWLTDPAPTTQDSTPHPSSHDTLGAFDTPFSRYIYFVQQCVCCVFQFYVQCLRNCWQSSVSVTQKTTSFCSVIRLLGFPTLCLHSTPQHFGEKRQNNDSSVLSCLFIHSFFLSFGGFFFPCWVMLEASKETMNLNSP